MLHTHSLTDSAPDLASMLLLLMESAVSAASCWIPAPPGSGWPIISGQKIIRSLWKSWAFLLYLYFGYMKLLLILIGKSPGLTGCSLNIVFFALKFCNFLNSASSAVALVFYLPGVCTHTDTEGKQRKARVRNICKKSGKNTIFNEHPVVASFWPTNPLCLFTFSAMKFRKKVEKI